MTVIGLLLVLLSLICVGVFWSVPRHLGQNGVAIITLGSVAIISPLGAAWLLLTTLVTPFIMFIGERTGLRGFMIFVWICILTFALVLSRTFEVFESSQIIWVGGAYFTLRHIHVLMDWWFRRLAAPRVGSYIRYQFYLPTIMAGPINRIQIFERQCARRRWDTKEFFTGAERALFGLAASVVVVGYLFPRLNSMVGGALAVLSPFVRGWSLSAVEWLELYVSFSALTHIALGLSLMMGLQLEENFDEPWRARNLIAFWQRWHITLSSWCRDYIFVPVTAVTRSPIVGVCSAMLVLGLWHEISSYYCFWAIWQTLGIVLTRIYMKVGDPIKLAALPEGAQSILGPVFVLIWLSLARPLADLMLLRGNL